MKTIKVKMIALMLVLVLALTGCMQQESGITINSDGSAKVRTTLGVEKQALTEGYLEMEKELAKELGTKYDEEEALKTMKESMNEMGYKETNIGGKVYYQMTETQSYKKGELQKEEGFEKGSYVTADTVYLKVQDQSEQPKEIEGMYGKKIDANSIKWTVTVQFSKKIVATNGTIDKANPNKATFNIPVNKSYSLFATTKNGVSTKTIADDIKKSNKISKPKFKSLKANKVKAKAKKASVTLKFKKVSGAKGYEIQYSTKSSFKGAKVKNIKKKTTYTIKNLKKGKKYYVRFRAYKNNYEGNKVTSKWVKKKVTTKK